MYKYKPKSGPPYDYRLSSISKKKQKGMKLLLTKLLERMCGSSLDTSFIERKVERWCVIWTLHGCSSQMNDSVRLGNNKVMIGNLLIRWEKKWIYFLGTIILGVYINLVRYIMASILVWGMNWCIQIMRNVEELSKFERDLLAQQSIYGRQIVQVSISQLLMVEILQKLQIYINVVEFT